MATSTDAMYNSDSRYIHAKYLIYFTSVPLEVTKSDYLVSSSLLEESAKISDSPFGDVTSNEITLALYNDDGIFNPQNDKGQYYNKIKQGVKIEAFIRPDDVDEWDKMGVFYVTEWTTDSSGMLANVTANDALYSILNGGVPSFPVYHNRSVQLFAEDFFSKFGKEVIVDPSISISIPYLYTSGYTSNKDLLTDIMNAALCSCFCNHDGDIVIKSRLSDDEQRAEITDNDQIVSATIRQSVTNSYDSVVVQCNTKQGSADETLLSISELEVLPGETIVDTTAFSNVPVLSVKSVGTTSTDTPVSVSSFSASASEFTCRLLSDKRATVSVEVIGKYLETITSTVGEATNATLEVSNEFIQLKSTAQRVRSYGTSYVEANVPTLELTVRGNPKFQIGDKIHVNSSKYKLDYTGVLCKAEYTYEGSLSCNIMLMINIR